ncbi:MAG: PEP-CTERM sorting domain-containing protein [Desmonostoc vinosum HA7617-LM4]|nr:PEP-CTERM sorting domain-containing protein [Desmonostoc vinosum HA7617-LM4]
MSSSFFNFGKACILGLPFFLVSFRTQAAVLGDPVGSGQAFDIGVKTDTLNTASRNNGRGFGNFFSENFYILGAKKGDLANDDKNTGDSDIGNSATNKYIFGLTFNAEDLKKPKQIVSFNLAFNGIGIAVAPSDTFEVTIAGKSLLKRTAKTPITGPSNSFAVFQAFNLPVDSTNFRAGVNYDLSFILTEYDTPLSGGAGPRGATVNTAVGFNKVKVDAVPEPLTVFSSGLALGMGAFIKSKYARKHQKVAKIG